ncbi:MAG: hypothetical protein WD059_00900 [Balneolaceae bacterium]
MLEEPFYLPESHPMFESSFLMEIFYQYKGGGRAANLNQRKHAPWIYYQGISELDYAEVVESGIMDSPAIQHQQKRKRLAPLVFPWLISYFQFKLKTKSAISFDAVQRPGFR